ncbi:MULTISPECIES: glucose-6-phosphate dehydrogenase [Enterococcus]|uniref:glucose-6-phosphate dehydrogenase n=1 Tax=Enterococcus sp. AZ103 TaxID=2774628 RepID=UPI003F264D88
MEQTALFTIFGGTGDLAKRKLYPSLFRLFKKGSLDYRFAVIGTARREWTDDYYREVVKESIQELNPTSDEAFAFASHFYYLSHDVNDAAHYNELRELSNTLDEKYKLKGNRLYYLAMSPQFFGTIVSHLKDQSVLTDTGFNRLVIEKPFGSDLKTATILNEQITTAFAEEDIFRIDHYLGKEMVQNIAVIRFANNIFESLWNNRYIENVQVTFAESLGVEDRGGYYENSGALRDMVQNHILQVVALLAMEVPTSFSDKSIRQEKIKVLEAIRRYDKTEVMKNFTRGQYAAGSLDDKEFIAYRDEPNVASDSNVETFVAGKFLIDNFRWSGVPFYIRTGKRMTEKGTRINIVFKQVPVNVFNFNNESDNNVQLAEQNVLTIYIQPTEGFSLMLNGKQIGQGFATEPVKLDFRQSEEITVNSPEAYEKLLLDALHGDGTNFSHWDEVRNSWEIVDRIRVAWEHFIPSFPNYTAGTMGPNEAFDLLKADGAHWIWRPEQWYKQRNKLDY